MADKKIAAALIGLIAFGSALRIYSTIKSAVPATDALNNWISVIIGVALIPLIYLFAIKLTENQHASLFSAALATTIPLFIWKTVAQLTHTVALFLFLMTLLSLIYIKELKDWKIAIILPIIFAFVHVYAIIILPIILFYFAFVKLEQKEFNKDETMFSLASIMGIGAIVLFFTLTPARLLILQQYVSSNYYSFSTQTFTLTKAFTFAGLIPVYLGAFGTYLGLKEKKKSALLMIAAGVTLLIAMSLNLIPLYLALPYFVPILAALASYFYKALDKQIDTMRIKSYKTAIELLAFAIVLAAGVVHFLSL
jgi:4-amino-4-deoxy-L-arabinose transferase-like glycosyltransferase